MVNYFEIRNAFEESEKLATCTKKVIVQNYQTVSRTPVILELKAVPQLPKLNVSLRFFFELSFHTRNVIAKNTSFLKN